MANYYPDPSRFGEYNPGVIQGVVGGIPSRAGGSVILASAYGFDEAASAATNASAISSALTASSEGDVIQLPAGTFSMNQVTIGYDRSNRTIRGAGMDNTIINTYGQNGFYVNGDADYPNVFNPSADIATLTAGSATITVVDGSTLPTPTNESNYRIGRIIMPNEPTTPVVSVMGYNYSRTPSVLMVGRSGNTVTLSQPLPSNFPYGSAGSYFLLGSQLVRHTRGIGIEDLTLDGTDSGVTLQCIYFAFVTGCWTKNVKALGHGTYSIRFSDVVNCETRGCWTDVGTGGGTNFAGYKLEQSSYGLAEDNIFVNNSPVIEIDYASTSNIVAYNYSGGAYVNINHGPHNSYNLFEGNSFWFEMSDGYYGSESEDTFFRNWYKSGVFSAQKRFSRNRNLVGNIVGVAGATYPGDYTNEWGLPNIGNTFSSGTWELSALSYSLDWDSANSRPYHWTGTLTTRTDNITGVFTLDSGMATSFNAALANASANKRNLSLPNGEGSSTITVTGVVGNAVSFTVDNISYILPSTSTVMWLNPGPNGFQEKDLDVDNTTERKANYYVFTGNIPAGESIAPDTLPDSYYLPAKPDWFGIIDFPAFDPFSPPASESAGMVAIPAGWRYVNGNSDYFGGGSGNITCSGTLFANTISLS